MFRLALGAMVLAVLAMEASRAALQVEQARASRKSLPMAPMPQRVSLLFRPMLCHRQRNKVLYVQVSHDLALMLCLRLMVPSFVVACVVFFENGNIFVPAAMSTMLVKLLCRAEQQTQNMPALNELRAKARTCFFLISGAFV